VVALLDVCDLRVEFRSRGTRVVAVSEVSLAVGAGESVGVVGESGCGKSTTGLAIMRLLPSNGRITGGAIRLEGRDLSSLSEREMESVRGDEVALIPQNPMTSLNPTKTIGEQIAEAVRLHRDASRKEALERTLEVLGLVHMPRPAERLDQYAHELSGGLRQRVMIAMALACEPKVLIADEPTTALDVTIQAQILDLIDELRERLRMGVVLITHDMGVIAGRTDRVVVMYAGKVVERARTTSLFRDMRHPYADALLAAVPKLDSPRTSRLLSIPGLPPDLSRVHDNCRFNPRCRFASEECRSTEPPMSAIDDGDAPSGHEFACFHPINESTRASLPGPVTGGVDATASTKGAPVNRIGGSEMLAVDHLVKEFPVLQGSLVRRKVGTVKAVSDVSFQVSAGEAFGLVGESGCGKTTIGWLSVALERPSSGTIRIDGREIQGLKRGELRALRREVQLMFQDPYSSLDPRMRVGEIVREPLRAQGAGSAAEQRARVEEVLGEVGLSREAASRYPHEFSGGQRQRIGLARALALRPKLIVADEPVSALDVSIQAQILNLMKDLQERHGLTFVLISHDLAVVRYMVDTIAVMYLGKLVELGPADEVYERPAHPYTRGLLDAVPEPDPELARERLTRETIRGELPSSVDPPSGCRFRTRCPRATDQCAVEEPLMRQFASDHFAACHFPHETPVSLATTHHAAGARVNQTEGAIRVQ
jgi:oligopeptide/dipeptide ABC transporter ATP-binding protein